MFVENRAGANGISGTDVVLKSPPDGHNLVARIQQEIAKVVRQPDMRERLGQFGAEPIASSPEDFAAFTKFEHDKYARLIKAAGIQPE